METLRKKHRKPIPRKNRILHDSSNFSVVEGYKTIRTNLIFATAKSGCKRVIFTSCIPGEGKTLSCCNLAITLAQTDSRVLVIDCDLRKPTVNKLFRVKGIPGLSELLAGLSEYSQCIQHSGYTNLNILCGGTIPPNPAELLGSDSMDRILENLSREYDYILLDTPPVNVVADALVLSPKADGVVLVVRQNMTTHPELKKAISSLKFGDSKILGILLNGVEGSSKNGHYQYSYSNRKTDEEYQ